MMNCMGDVQAWTVDGASRLTWVSTLVKKPWLGHLSMHGGFRPVGVTLTLRQIILR